MHLKLRLDVSGISCVRGGRVLYEGLSFSLAPGGLLLLSGPNGSGKTSLLRQIAGLLPLDAGTIELPGGERTEETHFIGHAAAIKDALTVFENLAFYCDLYGRSGTEASAALEKLKLSPLAQLPGRVLSAGQRRRLALARLVAIRRALWLLDEPDTALDAEGRATLLAIITEHRARGGMIVMASHGTLNVAPSREILLAPAARTAAA
jgi:heme exporter protein A